MSCTGCSICQRQSPPVANTAVRPRPYFCVINSGSLWPDAFISASTSAPGLGFPAS